MEEDFLVEEAMNPDVVLLPEGSSVRNATHEFVTHNISGAPVVAADGQVRGVLCKSDLTVPFMAPDGREIQINAMHIPFMENRSKEMLEVGVGWGSNARRAGEQCRGGREGSGATQHPVTWVWLCRKPSATVRPWL